MFSIKKDSSIHVALNSHNNDTAQSNLEVKQFLGIRYLYKSMPSKLKGDDLYFKIIV